MGGSTGSFQRLMDSVFRDLQGTDCWTFIDDVIFSDTIEKRARRLGHVLQRF
jgi:hypothetical protein